MTQRLKRIKGEIIHLYCISIYLEIHYGRIHLHHSEKLAGVSFLACLMNGRTEESLLMVLFLFSSNSENLVFLILVVSEVGKSCTMKVRYKIQFKRIVL